MLIDKLCYASKLRYVNSCVKTLFAVLTLIICICDRSVSLSVVVLLATGYLTIKKGGIALSIYLRLLRIPLAFLILSTIAILLNISPAPMDAFALPVGTYYLTTSFSALLSAGQLILTALASVSCLYFLSLSTPVTDVLSVMRKLHLPDLFIELMLLIYRFIFTLFEIADALMTAQRSRLGNINFRTSCKSFGGMASALFVRAIKKSSALYDAMEARCYDGKIRVLNEEYPADKRHVWMIAGFELALISLSAVLRLTGFHY